MIETDVVEQLEFVCVDDIDTAGIQLSEVV